MTPNLFDVKFEQIKADLKAVIPEHSYQMWIEPLWLMTNECTNNKMVIACPNEFSRKRTIENFLPQMQHLAGRIEIMLKTAIIVPPRPSVYLPTWPEDQFAAPSSIIRSPLFSIMQRRDERRYLKNEKIISYTGTGMIYTGPQLDQGDFEVFMYSCKLCSMQRIYLGELVQFERATFLREIGRHVGSRKWLISVFKRLQAGQLIITINGVTYILSLVPKFIYNENGNYAFRLDHDLIHLFGKDYVWIDKEIRLGLKGNLSKWLHAYICSHKTTAKAPHFVYLQNLHMFCGSAREFKKFKYDITQILKFFKEKGWIDYIIEKNNVLRVYGFNRPAQ